MILTRSVWPPSVTASVAVLFLLILLAASPATAQVFRVKEMSTEQIRSLDREKTVVLLPGGILEQHGPYLPAFTDGYLSERLTEELAQAIVRRPGWIVLVFPLTPLGAEGLNSIGGRSSFPGTYAVRSSTLRAVYMDLATELGEQGFRWIFVIHVHGAGLHNRALDQAGDYFHQTYGGQMVHLWGLVPVLSAWGEVLQALSKQERAEDGVSLHAGMDETSLMLFVQPRLVSPAFKNAPPVTGQSLSQSVEVAQQPEWPGYLGSPRLASAALGEKIMKALTAAFAKHALEILDGADPGQFSRYGDLLEKVPAYAAIDANALANERLLAQKQAAWLTAKGLQSDSENNMAPADSPSNPEIQRILDVTCEEADAVAASDAARYFAVLAPDAVFLPPNLPPKREEELRTWLRDFVENFRVEWIQYAHDQTVVEGSLAYHRYSYRWKVTPKTGGPAIESAGKGLHVLRRQPDGSWKIAVNLWNSSS